jgi:H+/Cl- antiporter ClcA
MIRFNNEDGHVATLAAAVFAAVIVVVAVIFIAVMANQQPTITDTYGNTLNPTSNTSQALTTTMTSEEEYSMVPLLFIIVAVFLCVVVFSAWVVAKTGISL